MSDDLKEKAEPAATPTNRRAKRPSFFGPFLLIALGVLFLLNNLGLLPALNFNWGAVFQLWPVFLILLGLNLIVRQARQPAGGILSALVGITAVSIFGYVLLFSEDNPLLARLGIAATPPAAQSQEIAFSAAGAESAQIELDFGAASSQLFALADDQRHLIAGRVQYFGDLIFDNDLAGERATVLLRESNSGFWWFNPVNWNNVGLEPWRIGLHPTIPTDLILDVGAGALNADLSGLTLSSLDVDGSAGRLEIALPGGEYEAKVDVGAGSTEITFADNGRQAVRLEGGAGSLTLLIPAEREARLEVDDGPGSFRINDDRFVLVSGREGKDGVWETAGYQRAEQPLEIKIDVSAGSVTVRQP